MAPSGARRLLGQQVVRSNDCLVQPPLGLQLPSGVGIHTIECGSFAVWRQPQTPGILSRGRWHVAAEKRFVCLPAGRDNR